jgi:predicted RNase H-like HicB family nuclease
VSRAGKSSGRRAAVRITRQPTELTILSRRILQHMRNEFTAIIERDGAWFVAYSPEVPGANGQGRTKAAARKNLAAAIALILRDRREDAMRGLPAGALRETVTVE